MRLYWLLLLLLIAPSAWADPGVEWARFTQEQAPALQARATSANTRSAAAKTYFDGRVQLVEAFPSYSGAPLDSPAWIKGKLDALDAAGAARSAERSAVRPELAAPWQDTTRQRSLEAALDAEDLADGLERRLLLGLQRLLEDHPPLKREALAPLRDTLQKRIDADDVINGADAASPEAAAARADALLAAEELQRLEVLVRGIQHAATASVPSPSPDADIARLAAPETSELALLRLALLRPFLAADAQQALDEATRRLAVERELPALQAALTAERSELTALTIKGVDAADLPPVAALEAELAALEKQIELARKRAAKNAAALDAAGDVRRLRSAIALERLLVKQERATLELQAAEDAGRLAQEKSAETRQEAERSREAGDDPRAKALTSLLDLLANTQSRTGELTRRQGIVSEEQSGRLDALKVELSTIETAISDAEALSNPLEARQRQNGLDAAYRELRQYLDELRKDAREADVASKSASAAVAELASRRKADSERLKNLLTILGDGPIGERQRDPLEISAEWTQESDNQMALTDAIAAEARTYRDEVVHLLAEARVLRRTLKREVSADELDTDRARLLGDIRQELALLGPNIATQAQDRLASLRHLPSRLLDLSWLRGVLFGSLWLVGVGLVWSWARRRAREVVHWALDRWAARASTPYRRSELTAVENPGIAAVIAAIDLGLGYALYNPVRESFAELGLVLLIYLQFATYRLLMNLFELAVARHPSIRPALLTLTEEPRAKAHRTVKVLALWGIVRQFVDFLTLEVLETDAINGLLLMVFRWLLIAISGWLLHIWEPDIRAALSRRPVTNRVTAFLVEPPKYPFERVPRALVGTVLLMAETAWNLVDVRAADRSGLGRLINWVNRRRLRREGTVAAAPPISSRLRHQLTVDDCPDEWFVTRAQADERFTEAIDGWMRERRAGRVVVIGDHGDGKGCWLDRRCAGLEAVGWSLTRARADHRITTRDELAGWMAGLLEVTLPADADPIEALMEALMDAPGRVWVLEGLEMAFLRTVGGFQAIRALFQIVQQCSEHHFWMLSVHGPAWRYLSKLPALFDTRFFRAQIALEPLREAQLRELIDRRMGSVDVEVSFSSMERGSQQADLKVERERAERTYFRMLSEASQGNAAVALELWADSLTPGATPEVVLAQVPESKVNLDALSDVDLFVLTAVRIQAELDEAELSSVINLGPEQIRATVRSLMDRGLLEVSRRRRARIPTLCLPGITRLLIRRHFLQR